MHGMTDIADMRQKQCYSVRRTTLCIRDVSGFIIIRRGGTKKGSSKNPSIDHLSCLGFDLPRRTLEASLPGEDKYTGT